MWLFWESQVEFKKIIGQCYWMHKGAVNEISERNLILEHDYFIKTTRAKVE